MRYMFTRRCRRNRGQRNFPFSGQGRNVALPEEPVSQMSGRREGFAKKDVALAACPKGLQGLRHKGLAWTQALPLPGALPCVRARASERAWALLVLDWSWLVLPQTGPKRGSRPRDARGASATRSRQRDGPASALPGPGPCPKPCVGLPETDCSQSLFVPFTAHNQGTEAGQRRTT